MREVRIEPTFSDWRLKARALLTERIPPTEVVWKEADDSQTELPGLFAQAPVPPEKKGDSQVTAPLEKVKVPASFLEMAGFASAHVSEKKWALLYRMLWRIAHGNPNLLSISIDEDVAELDSMVRMVRKDMHKMKAFVRFREVAEEDGSHFIAWHRPDHRIVPLVAPFFARRFAGMKWTILTDELSVRWDGKDLEYLPGCPRSEAPAEDAMEEVWKTYYASTFNPARIKLRMMKKEMAVRYWDTMPETSVIRDLLRDSSARLDSFFESQKASARDWFPKVPQSEWTLPLLEEAAKGCRACSICEKATQTVFGEGSPDSEIVFVGEQPGDYEDRVGRPFIGPAGKLLDGALEKVGIDRGVAYVTNAVKHFKWIPSGKIRLHQKPLSSEVSVCQSWLKAELEIVKPKVLVLLGATAAQAVLGRTIKLEDVRGQFFSTTLCPNTFITTHPAAILRTPDPSERAAQERRFLSELAEVRTRLE